MNKMDYIELEFYLGHKTQQIHGLKTGFKTDWALREAAKYISTFVTSDSNNFAGVWRDYLRMRVTINVSEPLKKRMKFRKRNGEAFYAYFKYERVPTFCFICGIMGHAERFCNKVSDIPVDQIVKPYSLDMKAPTRRQNFLTASPWLCSGKEDRREEHQGVNSTAANTSPNVNARPKNQPKSNASFDSMIAQSHNSGKQYISHNDHVILVNENTVGYSNEELIEISDLKRKRKESILSSGAELLIEDRMETDVENGTISWNCRGLGNPQAQQFLADICVQKKPKFVFLSETLCAKDVVEKVKNRLGFEGSFSVDVNGKKGGLAILWRDKSEAQLLKYSKSHIDLVVNIPGMASWRLSGLYGEPNRHLRHRTWTLLRTMATESNLPWCIIGDFNNILSNEDKKGGRPYPSSLLWGFQATIQDCNLIDLELKGYPYTWERSIGTANAVEI
ncbi:hypothetical protein CsatA_004075 [Cannabis sativa]